MPEYLAPGVYIEEISTGPRPIEGVGTSTAGFVGETERGPLPPNLITSWLAFQRWYGTFIPDRSYLPYAIKGFFDNGGKRCFVSRVVGDNAIIASAAFGALTISANGHGTWGNNIVIRVENGSQAVDANGEFRMVILYFREGVPNPFVDPTDPAEFSNPDRREPDALEEYDSLTHVEGRSNNVVTVVNAASKLIKCYWTDPTAPTARPGNTAGDFLPLAGGADGDPTTVNNFQGDLDPIVPLDDEPLGRGRGLTALAEVDPIAILLVPDEVRGRFLGGDGVSVLTRRVVQQCERLKDRFAVVSTLQSQSDVSNLRPPLDTLYGGVYYPWIKVFDAVNNREVLVPPSGHVAGIYARTDIERGVHKAPANAVVRGALDLEFPVPKGNQDILNPRGVNCLRDFRKDGRGLRVWGARTMSSDPEWKYVNVRRLFIFVEESVEEATQWVVFEPNHEPTWAKVTRSIVNFLIRIWRNGALQGVTQEEAFFVKCDRTTMTQDDIDNGRLICLVGLAPVKPAEFVIFRFSQKTIEAQN